MKHGRLVADGAVRLLLLVAAAASALAGGSGLNVAVVVNQNSENSLALGNYYCERRGVPPRNLIRINWTGGPIYWTRAQCQETLLDPLTIQLAQRGLTDQIDFVVLSMDLPYRVLDGLDANSTTSFLFYGFKANDWSKPGPCWISPEGDSGYFGSELPLRPRPAVTNPPRFLVTMLTAETLAEAKAMIDRGVSSDAAFPTQAVLLQKTSDAARSVRFAGFDNAVFQGRLTGLFPLVRTNSDYVSGLTGLLGLQTGLARYSPDADTFVPGAMADSLTSFGGCLFEPTDQTNLLEFIRAGATASYGTVVEPCNYTEKFPEATAYFYQGRGFALAECYYQSVANPYQGLVVGEPLAAPFARPGSGAWSAASPPDPGLRPQTEPPVLNGTTNLSLAFTAADASRPLQQIDWFMDGALASTLTNVAPSEGNVLAVKIDRTTVQVTVPAAATLASLASRLAASLNAQSNLTQVAATAVGDRIELASLPVERRGNEVSLTTSASAGSAAARTTFLRASQPRFLDSTALGARAYNIRGTAALGAYLRCTLTKTNGDPVSISVTNTAPLVGLSDLALRWVNQLNASPALLGVDGVCAEDFAVESAREVSFRLLARSPGLSAAQIQCEWGASSGLVVDPSASRQLDENVTDLRPRNHLYVTAGSLSLDLAFPFDSTAYPDGFHELTAVAYEGSSVQTQTRARTTVRIRNTTLEATLSFGLGASEVAVEATLPFTVVANRGAVARTDLLGTGGWLASVTNQATAAFALDGAALGPGRHVFQALVVAADGARYQTQPVELRLLARGTPFQVRIAGTPPVLSWPGVLGRTYEVLSGEGPADMGDLEATLTASSTDTVSWPIPGSVGATRFYRVCVPDRVVGGWRRSSIR